ncbi:DUF308 domain-containing protein [Romboutsia sp.]|uniref:DUF308 domain-containing protein n=1 Tax=Romboutsia sp. TaxID=1965302 RepID=UPI003F2B43BB
MFRIFDINFDTIYKKENSSKFTVLGALLIILGVISFLYKGLGIKLVSWTLCLTMLFLAYLNFKNINELNRYAPKSEVVPYKRIQFILLTIAILLFLFPQKIQGLISFAFGIYFIYTQLAKFFKGRNNPYYSFGFGNIFVLVIGFTLVFSPLFLSNFIASMLSILIILIGGYLFSTGKKLKN